MLKTKKAQKLADKIYADIIKAIMDFDYYEHLGTDENDEMHFVNYLLARKIKTELPQFLDELIF